jgi:hypothetical protein
LTNALRNGWDDVVSKEVGGRLCSIPRINSTDRIRAYLDMDTGEARFALFRPSEPGQWKEMCGKITGIVGPVCAAACFQKACTVSLGESSKVAVHQQQPEKAGTSAPIMWSLISLKSAQALTQKKMGKQMGEGVMTPQELAIHFQKNANNARVDRIAGPAKFVDEVVYMGGGSSRWWGRGHVSRRMNVNLL